MYLAYFLVVAVAFSIQGDLAIVAHRQFVAPLKRVFSEWSSTGDVSMFLMDGYYFQLISELAYSKRFSTYRSHLKEIGPFTCVWQLSRTRGENSEIQIVHVARRTKILIPFSPPAMLLHFPRYKILDCMRIHYFEYDSFLSSTSLFVTKNVDVGFDRVASNDVKRSWILREYLFHKSRR